MFNKKLFSERLKKLRKEKGVSQITIAKLLGVSAQQIADIENGKSTTSIERLCLLSEYFSTSIDYIVGMSNNPTNNSPLANFKKERL